MTAKAIHEASLLQIAKHNRCSSNNCRKLRVQFLHVIIAAVIVAAVIVVTVAVAVATLVEHRVWLWPGCVPIGSASQWTAGNLLSRAGHSARIEKATKNLNKSTAPHTHPFIHTPVHTNLFCFYFWYREIKRERKKWKYIYIFQRIFASCLWHSQNGSIMSFHSRPPSFSSFRLH